MSRRARVSAIVAAGDGRIDRCRRGDGHVAVGDEGALQEQRGGPDRNIERRVDDLLRRMTLDEKLQQLTLLSDGQMKQNPAEARKPIGGVFSETDPVLINKYQHDAVDNSRLHIPILFAFDTIHGFRTVFPTPLATASSFDPDIAFTDHRIGAFESAAVGLKQIYSPMVDVSHEPRWGRITEAAGEDPYLNSVMAAARVHGAQGRDYSAPDKTVTSVKHFVAYGQPESGRDYDTTDMSEQRLRNFYLPPFKAAIDAGADTVMCSFNAINGVAGCANPYTETDILKDEWDFDGFIESDYTAVAELRACPGVNPAGGPCGHGVAADGARRGRPGAERRDRLGDGLDQLPRLRRAARREPAGVDEAHRRRRAPDPADQVPRRAVRAPVRRRRGGAGQAAPAREPRRGAERRGTLGGPAQERRSRPAAVEGQEDRADRPAGRQRARHARAVVGPRRRRRRRLAARGPEGAEPEHDVHAGLHDEPQRPRRPGERVRDARHPSVVAAANAAEQVIIAVGETREMGGEAESRSNLDLPGKQQDLIDAVKGTGKPFAVVLFNSRPLTLSKVAAASPAILEAWFGGVEAGNGVADVLFGMVNPGGKLPVSFPRNVGQIPIYYNHEQTGRPCDVGSKYNSRHRDIASCAPLYEFGFGLSYTTFKVDNLRLSSGSMNSRGSITASVDVTNTGPVEGDDVAQLYIHDPVASISQPVRRLRGFERVTLKPGGKTTVSWKLDASDVGFYDNRGKFRVEPGVIEVYAGDSSSASEVKTFTVR